MIEKINWYKNWFNSPFYPILYHNRDARDARVLLDNLIERLEIHPDSRILDLACGRGRHSVYLNMKGYDVTGLDMSKSSILEASLNINTMLRFLVGDMRFIPYTAQFDYVLNLFTSFGYFEDEADHLRTLESIKGALKPGGIFILDFFNATKLLNTLVEEEKKEVQGITFHIARSLVDNKIRKQIEFEHDGSDYYFEESVEAFTLKDFESLIEKCGFKILETFGDYELNPYSEQESERIILIAQA
ncbi:MAG: methyltransferase domain-containing protein [Bacteroidetes bacterium]|nr:methyltransferase domain-containing protein [Bacteroidota bacterium]